MIIAKDYFKRQVEITYLYFTLPRPVWNGLAHRCVDHRIFSKNAVRNSDDLSNRNPIPRIAKNYGYKYNPVRDKWRQVYAEYLEKELISYRPTHIVFLGSLGHRRLGDGDGGNYTTMRSVLKKRYNTCLSYNKACAA